MSALLSMAETLVVLKTDQGLDVTEIDFEIAYELAFWDTDFRALFRPELDGIHDSAVGDVMGMTNLDRSRWFGRFPGAATPPHPMTWRR